MNFFSDITQRIAVQKRLRQTDRLQAFGVLAGGIAHEINNMLTPAMLHADLLDADLPEPEERHESVAVVRRSLDRVRELVERLLTFSGQSRLTPGAREIGDMVRKAVGDLAGTLPPSIRIDSDIAEGIGEVAINAGNVYLILSNLVQRSRDATESGGRIGLTLSAVTVTQGDAWNLPELRTGSYALLKVRDTGPRMASEAIGSAEEPLSQAWRQGTVDGLGVTLVQGIVAQHRGALTLEETDDGGMTARVFLPIVPSPGRTARDPAEEAGGREETARRG